MILTFVKLISGCEFRPKSCPTVHDNHIAHLEYSWNHWVTGCFAPINQVSSVRGKPFRQYKVDTYRLFSPGPGPTQSTGARLLLFALPRCRHGGHTRLYQVTVNQRGDSLKEFTLMVSSLPGEKVECVPIPDMLMLNPLTSSWKRSRGCAWEGGNNILI